MLLPNAYLNLVCPYFPSSWRRTFESPTIEEGIRRGKQRGSLDWKFQPSQEQSPFFGEGIGSYLFYSLFFHPDKIFESGLRNRVGDSGRFLFLSEWCPHPGVGAPWRCGNREISVLVKEAPEHSSPPSALWGQQSSAAWGSEGGPPQIPSLLLPWSWSNLQPLKRQEIGFCCSHARSLRCSALAAWADRGASSHGSYCTTCSLILSCNLISLLMLPRIFYRKLTFSFIGSELSVPLRKCGAFWYKT